MKWNQKGAPCMIKQHMSFLSLVKGKYYFIDACNLQSLVDWSGILVDCSTYDACLFLHHFCRVKQLHIRVKLDRRQFESAHLRFAILNVSSRYSEIDGPIPMYSSMTDTLQIFTPKFYNAFEKKYSGM